MKKLLIIDDDEDIRLIVRAVLESSGQYQVRESSTAQSGLNVLLDKPADLLLLDYLLPDSTGSDVLASLKRHGLLDQMDVVMLTARQDKDLTET